MKPKPGQPFGAEKPRGHRKWPPEVRLQMAQAVVDRKTPVATVAQAFGIPVTTVMDWAHRYRKYGPDPEQWWPGAGKRRGEKRETKPDARRAAVVATRRAHPEQGTRRIRDVMARFQGLGVSETTVRRILHEEGLLETVAEPVAKPGPPEHRFERAEPNQLWQSDIFTFLLRRHHRLYVTAFMDDYSRYLVSLLVAHHQKASLVLEALARGIAEYGAPREVLTDQGRQYVSWRGHTDFEAELHRQGIRHIKSRPHHPQTLGKIERFWKTLWEEFLSRTVFADFEDCQRRIGLFVQAYNFRRPHQGIGGAVPADRFFRAAPQVRDAIEKGVASNALALARERPQRKPFYLVGCLGGHDFSVVLAGAALTVRLGEVEETIALGREERDDDTSAQARAAEEPSADDTEVALEVGGDRPDRAAAVPDGAERAVGGNAGDGRDQDGGDLAGDVLPAGDARATGHAAGAGTAGERGGSGDEPGAPDRSPGGEGEGTGESGTEVAAAAAHDAAGDRVEGEENRLDEEWEKSFAALAEDSGGPAVRFEPDGAWRERPLTWERKLSGSDEASHVEEDLYGPAADTSGARPPLRSDDGGDLGGADGERRGEATGPFAEPFPEPAAPGARLADQGAGAEDGRTAPDAGAGEGTGGGNGPPALGERASEPARGDGGEDPGAGQRDAEGPDGPWSASWARGAQAGHGGWVSAGVKGSVRSPRSSRAVCRFPGPSLASASM
jgi:transposase InsO family protein